MRKKDLMFTHMLLNKCVEFMAETDDLARDDIVDEYTDVDLDRPRDPRAPKSDQKEAVYALLSDLNTTIEQLDTVEEGSTDTTGDSDTAEDGTETETDSTPADITVA